MKARFDIPPPVDRDVVLEMKESEARDVKELFNYLSPIRNALEKAGALSNIWPLLTRLHSDHNGVYYALDKIGIQKP